MLNTAGLRANTVKISATLAAIIIATFGTAIAIERLAAIIRKSFVMRAATIIETRVGILTGGIIETTIDATREVIIGRLIGREATIVRPPGDIFATDPVKPC